MLAHNRIPKVKGRIKEERISMRVIGTLPERERLEGVKKLIKVKTLEKDH
jgi:hypothetical protein